MKMNDKKNKPANEKPEAETVDSNGIKNQFNAEAEPQPEEPTDSSNTDDGEPTSDEAAEKNLEDLDDNAANL